MSNKVEICDDGVCLFWCPGCKEPHGLNTDPKHPADSGALWTFDGNIQSPTFSPSLRVERRCHSIITEGIINYLTDSLHSLAGKSVEMVDWD